MNEYECTLGHPDFQFFFSFHVFRDFFYAVFCADSENVLKNVIRSTSGKLWGGFDPPLFQNLVNILNSVFSFKVMILRVILFKRALNSVQLKKICLKWSNKLRDMKRFVNNFLLRLSYFWRKVAFYTFKSTATGLIWVNMTKRLQLCSNEESENLLA